MSKTTNNELEEAAQRVFREAAERELQPADWGFCAYGDASPGIGGGIPGFFWFENVEAMKVALRGHALFLHPPMDGLDLASAKAAVEAAVAAAGNSEDLQARLNACLKHCSQFMWIGSFKELCEGNSTLAQKVRAEFRGEGDRETHVGPIDADEMPEFTDYLSSYGI